MKRLTLIANCAGKQSKLEQTDLLVANEFDMLGLYYYRLRLSLARYKSFSNACGISTWG